MQLSVEWQEQALNAAIEERQTVADLRVSLNGQNVTLHLDGQTSVDHVTIALYGLVEGLTHDWWRIFGARDSVFSLIDYRSGYVVPDLQFSFDGEIFQIGALQRRYRNPDIRFWFGPTEIMDRTEAECQLGSLIEKVLERLEEQGVSDTSAALRWRRVQQSRADAAEAFFCEAAGALGADPYQIDERAAKMVDDAAAFFEREPLIEFLAGAHGTDEGKLLGWVAAVQRRPRYQARVADLRDVAIEAANNAPSRAQEASWALGYRRAKAMRRLLRLQDGDRFTSYRQLGERLGASTSFRLAPHIDGIRVLRSDESDGVRLHMRTLGASAGATELLFSFSRAVGDVACFPDESRAPINGLHAAYRQAAGRAFAAEFLAPIYEVRSMRGSGRDVLSIAEYFGVSTTLIERQLQNESRIEQACA